MKPTIGLFALLSLSVLGCAHAPTQPGARADLRNAAQATLRQMEARDSTLRPLLKDAAGYIVFPAVGEGGLLVGAGAGTGVLYERDGTTHFAELRHLEAGALAGGQRYSEVVVVRDPAVLRSLRTGRYDFSADAGAIIVRTGAAATATFEKGVAVFVAPIRGAFVNASVGGQRIRLTL